jgi:DMSO/TMAO reductase YedYZ molybdopterin-dependent catalytic subunit
MTLSGCDLLSQSRWFRDLLGNTERLTEHVQRLLASAGSLAPEYAETEISAVFPANGNSDPGTLEYARAAAERFAGWKVAITGLVAKPANVSFGAITRMPSRTQITRHDCVEGWSAIGKWTGVPLGDLMHLVEPFPGARYAVFHCADVDDTGVPYYESMAVEDLYHPQTILAYELNGAPLDIAHGAPLRLRFERQLGYKHAKYVWGIELVESFADIGGGKGGYWEDQGYEWYAGI